ncbi:MAG: yhfT [Firmicutes bacterium]|nr:yhfT [Bacillota bacterium]
MMNYFTLLKNKASKHKDKLFLRINQQNYSYEDIVSAAKRLGEQIKLEHTIVLIYSDSLLFQITAFFAMMKAGNIPIISHYDLPPAALKKMLMKNQIQYLLSDRKQTLAFIVNDETVENAFLATTSVEIGKSVDPSICMGALSSGSTDVPKVLFRTYESWAEFFPIQNQIFKVDVNSILFLHGSLSFTGNLNAVLSVLYEGGSLIVTDLFQCKTWLKTIQEFQVTTIYLVPAKLKTLNKCMNAPITSVNMIFTGSQLLFSQTAIELKEKFINSSIILYYGTSELNYITYIEYDELIANPLSVGKPFPNVVVSIEDEYIYIDTPYHVDGVELPYTVYDRGYFEKQQLIFLGRKENVMNKGGFKVSCVKVEEEIKKIPKVDNIAVVAYQDDKKGSEMAAFIVANATIDKDYIRSKIKGSLMAIEIPKKFIFIDEIPLNTSGKVDLQKLKALL